MKTLTQSHLRVIMWNKVMNLSQESNFSARKIAHLLGLDPRTVRSYQSMSEKEFYSSVNEGIRKYVRRLDAYYDFVKKLLNSDSELTAAAIEDRLKENFEDLPVVSSKTFYNFVGHVRKSECIPKHVNDARIYEKLSDLDYGIEAQVDFGECWMTREGNRRKKVYFFAIILCRSRYKYVRFQDKPFTGKDAVECHDMAFSYFQGIPQKLLYDQDSVFIVNENLGDYLLTNDFSQYVQERKLKVVFARKADPETKGRVENLVKYVKSNFLRARIYHDLKILNQEALNWLERTGNGKEHAGTKLVPKEEWQIEKQYLRPFEGIYYEIVDGPKKYTVRKDNTICYQSCWYTLPSGTYQGEGTEITLKEEDGRVIITDIKGNLIANHEKSMFRGVLVSNTSHRRDRTLGLDEFKQEVLDIYPGSDLLKVFIVNIQRDKSRYVRDNLTIIRKVLNEYDKEAIEWSLKYCIDGNLWNANRFSETAEYFKKHKSAAAIVDIQHEDLKTKSRLSDYDKEKFIPATSNINVHNKIMGL